MKKLLPLIFAALLCSAPVFAGTYTFNAVRAASMGVDAEDASATFVTSMDSITVTLSNNFLNVHDAGQLLSDLSFTLDSLTVTTGSATLSASSGRELFVDSNATFPTGFHEGSVVQPIWGVTSPAAHTFKLDDLNNGDGPAHTIIGPSNNGTYTSGAYSVANSSIAGSKTHNPFLESGTSFTLSLTGVTSNTVITGATFSFGTTSGDNVVGIAAVPEPSSLAFLVLGAGASLCGCVLRKRQTRAS
jgi:hypothetical protein